jgi:hypothetical protein
MIGVHQGRGGRDDAVPVGVRVIGERDAVLILQVDQPGHGIGAGAIHAGFAVVVDGHE